MLGLVILFAVASAIVVALYVGGIVRDVLHPPRATAGWALARGRPMSPADLGLSAKEWTLERPGAALPVWEIELSDAPGGATVILVHGWGHSRIDSLGRIAPYLDHADRILLVDLRGHGDATGRTRLGAVEEHDLAALVERCPDGPIVLVGHSLGATIAIRCAADTPAASRVAGVVAIAPFDTVVTPIRQRLLHRDLPAGVFLRLAMLVLRAFGVTRRSTIECARRLRPPLLVIHGEHDRVAPPDEGRAIAEAARGRFVLLHETDHLNHDERHPTTVADVASVFLDEIAAPASAEKTAGDPKAARRHR
ncbi:MAG: alpha/beta fold hydrolase [Phycisphaerales bacterium]